MPTKMTRDEIVKNLLSYFNEDRTVDCLRLKSGDIFQGDCIIDADDGIEGALEAQDDEHPKGFVFVLNDVEEFRLIEPNNNSPKKNEMTTEEIAKVLEAIIYGKKTASRITLIDGTVIINPKLTAPGGIQEEMTAVDENHDISFFLEHIKEIVIH